MWRIETWGNPEDHAEPGHQARCYAKQVDQRRRVSYVAAESTFFLPFLAYLKEVAP